MIKKRIWRAKFPIRPPPPYGIIHIFFNLSIKWKMLTPPLGSNSDNFEFEIILTVEALFRHIYMKNGQIKCFSLSFFWGALKVIYNHTFFWKILGLKNSQIKIGTFFVFQPFPNFFVFFIKGHQNREWSLPYKDSWQQLLKKIWNIK